MNERKEKGNRKKVDKWSEENKMTQILKNEQFEGRTSN